MAGKVQICTGHGGASLAAASSQAAAGTAKRGSMSPKWMEFVNDREVVASVDLVRGKDAILTVDFEDGERDHQVTGKLESVRLGENEIVRHVERLHRERANPARWLQKGLGPGAITATAQPSGRSLLADPTRVDRGKSGPGPGRHHKRAELVCCRSGFRLSLVLFRQLHMLVAPKVFRIMLTTDE